MPQHTETWKKLPIIAPKPKGLSTFSFAENATPAKRRRACSSKVRTACLTCKRRRVKCDEEQPTCARCNKAKIECEGYVVVSKCGPLLFRKFETACNLVHGRRPLLPRSVPLTVSIPDSDVPYFDMFRYRLVQDLSGYCCSDFWSRIVLCEGIRDHCIRESILAIGALSQAVSSASYSDHQEPGPIPSAVSPWSCHSFSNQHHKAAIFHHFKAVSTFRQRILPASRISSPRFVLIMTILLITFELLQSNMRSAASLMTSSLNLLKDSLHLYRDVSQNTMTRTRTRSAIPVDEEDMENIGYMLPSLSVMSGYTPFLSSQLASIASWDSIAAPVSREMSWISIERLQTQWGKFFTCCSIFFGKSLVNQLQNRQSDMLSAGCEQRAFLSELDRWKAILDGHPDDSIIPDDDAKNSLRMLKIHRLLLHICISSCLDHTELTWDKFEKDFGELVKCCFAFVSNGERMARGSFTLSPGVISPLGATIVKCRNHDIRMMAADVLRRVSWREGAWDAKAMIIGKLGGAMLEERGRDAAGFIPPEHRWFWTAGHWNMERRELLAQYVRATPDVDGMLVKTSLRLNIDRLPKVCREAHCIVDHAIQCSATGATSQPGE